MRKKFRFTLKVKDCDKSFGPNFDPGVLVVQDVEIEVPDDYDPIRLARWKIQTERDLIEENIEVVREEIE